MYLLVHNTSPVQRNHTAIAVPHGQYKVEIYDLKIGQYVEIEHASVLCSQDYQEHDAEE
jgi:hypothetical protein